ncbi:MAG: hypothetical protein FWG87_09500 [Defluviitaleaceae bacterium]|nr:hypothetical protein [Defluviitaleaceae bacterium]
MGKQINFFMDSATMREFESYVVSELKFNLYIQDKQGYNVFRADAFPNVPPVRSVAFHKEDLGELLYRKHKSGATSVNIHESYAIEFSPTYILHEKKHITRGRIYSATTWIRQIENEIALQNLKKYHDKLARWIRKNIPKNYGEYLSESLIELLMDGYTTGV